MKWYSVLVGIEHIMTGISFIAEDEKPEYGYQFELESPTMYRVWSDKPFNTYWEVKGAWNHAVEMLRVSEHRYSDGEVNFAAKRMVAAMNAVEAGGTPLCDPPLPAVCLKALRAKFGADPIPQIRYSSSLGCWHFEHAGMFFGIEPDGYIHT